MPVRYYRLLSKTGSQDQAAPGRETINDVVQIKNTTGIIQSAQIFERARERYKWAVNTLGVSCYLYRKLTQGRKCSCKKKDNIPSGMCPVCFGTGFVGGYLQYGHEKYVLDATAPLITLSGLETGDGPEDINLRPSPITLEQDAHGFVESGEDIQINGALAYDGFQLFYDLPARQGGQVTASFWDGSSWQLLSTFQTYLDSLGSSPWKVTTRFRVDMYNYSDGGKLPCFFYGLHVKWRLADDVVKIEQATFQDMKNKLTDLGFVDASSGIQYTMNYRPRVSTRDFFVKASDGSRLKVTVAKMGDPADQPLWQDLTLRPIQEDAEILSKVF